MRKIAEELLSIGAVELDLEKKVSSDEGCALKCYPLKAYGNVTVSNRVAEALESLADKMCEENGGSEGVMIICASVRIVGWGYSMAVDNFHRLCTYVLSDQDEMRFSGHIDVGVRAIVVTDFVYSGDTVLNVVTAARAKGVIVIGVVAVIGSGSKHMRKNLDAAHVSFKSATDFSELQKIAKEMSCVG